jgi:hypothetical protein
MRAIIGFLILFAAGCTLSTTTGQAGQVDFVASDCGALFEEVTGCDLKQPLAQGGRVAVTAKRKADGAALSLRSGRPATLEVEGSFQSGWTLSGKGAGSAELIAFDGVRDVDRLTVRVAPVAQFVALEDLIKASGKYTPAGLTDGTFEVTTQSARFTLALAQVGDDSSRLIGRDSFTLTLPAGLTLRPDKPAPTGLLFEFERPQKGTYEVLIRARTGVAQLRIKIVVNT